MRQIKFRGLKIDKSGWIYGMPMYDFTHIFSEEQVDSYDNYEVITETVGEFTGITDKNGVEIYEGDKLKNLGTVAIVKFENGMFCITPYVSLHDFAGKYKEIIGNIHENPESLT